MIIGLNKIFWSKTNVRYFNGVVYEALVPTKALLF